MKWTNGDWGAGTCNCSHLPKVAGLLRKHLCWESSENSQGFARSSGISGSIIWLRKNNPNLQTSTFTLNSSVSVITTETHCPMFLSSPPCPANNVSGLVGGSLPWHCEPGLCFQLAQAWQLSPLVPSACTFLKREKWNLSLSLLGVGTLNKIMHSPGPQCTVSWVLEGFSSLVAGDVLTFPRPLITSLFFWSSQGPTHNSTTWQNSFWR